MEIEIETYTFPDDFSGTFNGRRLAGETCRGGCIAKTTSLIESRIFVKFYDAWFSWEGEGDSWHLIVPADATPELFALCQAAVLEGFGVSTESTIGWPCEYRNAETGDEMRFLKVLKSKKGLTACSVSAAKNFKAPIILIDHPEFGIMGVTPLEQLALQIPEM